MTNAVTSSVLPLITTAQPSVTSKANVSQVVQSQSSGSSYGDAVKVDLSAPAQAVIASQNISPAATTNTPPKEATTPVASQAATVDVAQLVSAAKQKVAPQVGIGGASDVVDKQGNISRSALAVEVAEQAQKR